MKREKISQAMGNISSRHIKEAAAFMAEEKPHKNKTAWVKWASLAVCFCIMLVSVFLVQYFNNHQFEIPPTVKFNDAEYVICGSKGEATILEQANLPTVLTKGHAGKQLAYLKVDNNIFSVTETATHFVLYEYAPVPNSNVYIVLIDGEYYAAIRHDSNGYHGITE